MFVEQASEINVAVEHARANRDRVLDRFRQLLSIPSISTDPAFRDDVQRAADWLVADMQRIGLEHCRSIATSGQPVVYGDWLHAGADRPTVLIYAHYDVQPVDPLALWETPPFEPSVRDGKLYARGAIDDKCGVYANLAAIESIMATAGGLPLNIKLLFEGEEETGSPSMAAFVAEQRDLLAADLLIISDGGSEPDQPLNISALRGEASAEIVVRGPRQDLHSGSFGGIVHNPNHKVAEIIAALHDASGRIQIPGFYDDVAPLTPAERAQLDAEEATMQAWFRAQSGVTSFWGPSNQTVLERATAQPTCDVTGIYGGYQGAGNKTIIPASAGFKLSMRLVADQDPHDIARKLTAFIDRFRSVSLRIEVTIMSGSWPATLLSEGPAIEAIDRAYVETWGKPALLYRQGGSVPVMGDIQRALHVPMTTLGHGTGENGHAPNEFLDLRYFFRGIETTIHALHYLATTRSFG